MAVTRDELVGVVLAAGAGTRLRPLTLERPKAMCPVGTVPLVDHALAQVAPHVAAVAVNAHGSQQQLVDHVAGRAHVSVEAGDRLGTAGALGRLAPWIAGRHVLVHNADAYVDDDLDALLDGWTGEHPRLLVRTDDEPRDFGAMKHLGVSLVPARAVATFPDAPAGFYSLLWQPAWRAGTLETVEVRGTAIDCGTPADYLRANLHASNGENVVDPSAVVEGSLTRCVVWPGAHVYPDEALVDCIRTQHVTVDASS